MERKANEKPFDIGLMTGGHGSKLYGVKISFNQGEFNRVISHHIVKHIEEEADNLGVTITIDSELSILSAEMRIVSESTEFLMSVQEYVDALDIGTK